MTLTKLGCISSSWGPLRAKEDEVWPPKLVQTLNRAGKTTQGLVCTLGTPWRPAAPNDQSLPCQWSPTPGRDVQGGSRLQVPANLVCLIAHCAMDNREQHTVGT